MFLVIRLFPAIGFTENRNLRKLFTVLHFSVHLKSLNATMLVFYECMEEIWEEQRSPGDGYSKQFSLFMNKTTTAKITL